MLNHIVFYKLQNNSLADIEKVRDVFLEMKGKIQQLKYIEIGIDVLHSERSFDLALITKFDSLDDFKAYKENPIHVEVSKYIHSVWKESASVDYETLD